MLDEIAMLPRAIAPLDEALNWVYLVPNNQKSKPILFIGDAPSSTLAAISWVVPELMFTVLEFASAANEPLLELAKV